MATLSRRIRLDVPADRAFAACLRLLTDADPSRGVLQRRCVPAPPREGSQIITVVRDHRGERTLHARIVELDAPRSIATATDDEGPAVRTQLTVAAVGDHSIVTLTSDATTALGVMIRATGVIDRLLLARAQRRAAKTTLKRLKAMG